MPDSIADNVPGPSQETSEALVLVIPAVRASEQATVANLDQKTVEGFGYEWSRFDQSTLTDAERWQLFESYFDVFPWDAVAPSAVGADIGCGSGRWAKCVAPKVGTLHCVDASAAAIAAARKNLSGLDNCQFHNASIDELPFGEATLDFAYSLGVLHHLPDTAAGLQACVQALKPGAPFLLYVYYNLDNRSFLFRQLWRCSDVVRRVVSRLPLGWRAGIASVAAATVYWPLARIARILEGLGIPVDGLPLSFYRRRSFFVMRTDAFDRFATPVEGRFSANEVIAMMVSAGLERVHMSERAPFWHAVGFRKGSTI